MATQSGQLSKEKSDQELIRALKQNDPEAFQILWEWLYTLAASRKYQESERTRDAARDAAVAAYHRIVTRGVYNFKFQSPFKWYCATIFANEANRALKKKGISTVNLGEDEGIIFVDESQDVEEKATAESQTIRKRLEPCLQALPAREREIIEQLYYKNLAPSAAAEIAKIARNNVNQIAYRARRKLLRCLQLAGFASAAEVISL